MQIQTTSNALLRYTLIYKHYTLNVTLMLYTTIKVTDDMDGHDFEYWCAGLLNRSGFKDVAVVITNNTFTPSAIELAQSADVDLWDEATLDNLLYKVVRNVV